MNTYKNIIVKYAQIIEEYNKLENDLYKRVILKSEITATIDITKEFIDYINSVTSFSFVEKEDQLKYNRILSKLTSNISELEFIYAAHFTNDFSHLFLNDDDPEIIEMLISETHKRR